MWRKCFEHQPNLTEKILGGKKFTNHSIRATAITNMKRAEIADRKIIGITGHKSIENLSNYDAALSMVKKVAC